MKKTLMSALFSLLLLPIPVLALDYDCNICEPMVGNNAFNMVCIPANLVLCNPLFYAFLIIFVVYVMMLTGKEKGD